MINIKTIDGKQIAVNYPQTAEVEVVDTTDYSSSGGQKFVPTLRGLCVVTPVPPNAACVLFDFYVAHYCLMLFLAA